jgi:hypothetical protein
VQQVTVYITEGFQSLNAEAGNCTKVTRTQCRRDGAESNKKMANDVWRGRRVEGVKTI